VHDSASHLLESEETSLRTYVKGDRVRYIARPVFDLIIETGEVGIVERVDDGWVHAWWPRSGLHSVPEPNVEPAGD
jgi:hypothetical protein